MRKRASSLETKPMITAHTQLPPFVGEQEIGYLWLVGTEVDEAFRHGLEGRNLLTGTGPLYDDLSLTLHKHDKILYEQDGEFMHRERFGSSLRHTNVDTTILRWGVERDSPITEESEPYGYLRINQYPLAGESKQYHLKTDLEAVTSVESTIPFENISEGQDISEAVKSILSQLVKKR